MIASNLLVTAGMALGFFVVCMLVMAVGLLVRGMVLRGGCRGDMGAEGKSGCSTCSGDGACKREGGQGGKPSEAASR